jgi:hypothetical protein
MRSHLIARAGLASLPVTAFAPLAGAAMTGYGTPWMVLPIGSVVALVGGGCAHRRDAAIRRRGVIVADPDLNDLRETLTAPRDEITVEFTWSDEAA